MEHLTAPEVDRLDHLRGLEGTLTPATRVLTVWEHRALIRRGEPVTVSLDQLGEPPADSLVLLGDSGGVRFAARSARSREDAARLEAESGGRFESLRNAATLLPSSQAGLLYYGAALHAWHGRVLYCGTCGSPTRATHAGHQRVCTDPACGAVQFPRTDPAVITLVRRGDRALLLHQPDWPPGRFSTLAGFVEPGETLEGAVRREVAEEVGLSVESVEYVASQPWPFPHTLMIGFRTWAGEGDVVLGDEVEETRWYTRVELRRALAQDEVTISPPFSLARSLIEEWLGEAAGRARG